MKTEQCDQVAELYEEAKHALVGGRPDDARRLLMQARTQENDTVLHAGRLLALAADLRAKGQAKLSHQLVLRAEEVLLASRPPLSRRDIFAGLALAGLVASEWLADTDPQNLAHDSVRIADALLSQLDGATGEPLTNIRERR
jgi:hypothetical protein